ncbi:replication initiation protein [Hymenobacter sp. BT635]|uniref:Replication initiation protein n=1 Tax=Hymenobacter nitidus TaxID=2880929 RepID=A0ABS8ALT7_9BACT|nr:replication initiation protein [Hymenobacter nitidus]MCB2380479.1 replication initiation protein [Hymenobacter nitidus]
MAGTLTVVKSPLHIRQHNALTTARYEYSELQLDFLFFLISKLRATKDNVSYTLSISELSALTGKRYNYKYLQEATAAMGSRLFEIKTEGSYKQLWMFQSVDYLHGQGIIEVKLSEDILPFLFDLKNNFTSYELQAALKLTSKYAKRIYPLCSQWKDRGATPLQTLRDFKHMLGLITKGKEEYPTFGPFKTFVLNTAIKQINENTDIEIELVTEKLGRAVHQIGFKVSVKPYALQIQFSNDHLPAILAPDGINHEQYDNAERILDEVRIVDEKLRHQILSSSKLVRAVLKFSYDLRTGKIVKPKNAGGYLLTALGLAPRATKSAAKSS